MRARRALPIAVVLLLVLAACASIAPGEDPVVVRTEQLLTVATPIYDSGMAWYFANAKTLSVPARQTLETIRVGFPPAYRALDSALQLYKAGKRKDVMSEFAELQRLVEQCLALTKALGGPDLAGGPK